MPLKDGDPNPTKTKSNCLCMPFFGHFLTPLERVAATTSSCVCVCVYFFSLFLITIQKKQAEVFTFIVVLNNLLRLGHKGWRTPKSTLKKKNDLNDQDVMN